MIMLFQFLTLTTVSCPSPQGCCCCTGACFYQDCPPCPCPAPPPGHPEPKCGLQTLQDSFTSKYAKLVAPSSALTPKDWPDKTHQSKTDKDAMVWGTSDGWRSGFFPGILWQLGNASFSSGSQGTWRKAAAAWTAGREVEKTNTGTHDVGFMVYGSFGAGLTMGDLDAATKKQYESIVVETAHSLAVRWSPTVQMLRSWGSITDEKTFEVIIDNMCNLELMWAASKISGNKTLATIAKAHAVKTAKYWLREDGSSPHLCKFSPTSGALETPCTGTPQGYANDSTWARGQGWAVYGFTMAYRFTAEPSFLSHAIKFATFFLNATAKASVKSGSVMVPPWDFDLSIPTAEAFPDTSSAAIVASALLELAQHTGDASWRDSAVAILSAIPGRATAASGKSESVLAENQHDCADAKCAVIESDHYLLEALRRLEMWKR